MSEFGKVRSHITGKYKLEADEPFVLSFDVSTGERMQTMFVAEVESSDGKRFIRISTPITLLENFDAERCLRINWTRHSGFLAVGDLEDKAYIKMCQSIPCSALNMDDLDYVIDKIAKDADNMEQVLDHGHDFT